MASAVQVALCVVVLLYGASAAAVKPRSWIRKLMLEEIERALKEQDDQELRRTILSPDDAAPVELTAEENVARTLQENAPESHAEREQHIKKTVNNELGVYGSESYLEPIQRQIQPLSLQKTLVEKQKTEEEEKKEVQEAKEVETSEAELRRELIERLLRELDEQR